MKKRVILVAFLAIFILLGMGISSALNTIQEKEKSKDLDKLDSPLFQIATKKAINNPVEKKGAVYSFIISFLDRFFNDRIFYTPLLLLLQHLYQKLRGLSTDDGDPCPTDKNYTEWCTTCDVTSCWSECYTNCKAMCP